MQFISVNYGEREDDIRSLLLEYLHWGARNMNQYWNLGITVQEVDEFIDTDIKTLSRMQPPNGRFYLIQNKGTLVGVGGLRRLNKTSCELKRMYIRKPYRGQGIGLSLLHQLLHDARALQFKKVYLDTPLFCKTAQKLYETNGFRYIDKPYPGNEYPKDRWFMMKFMELDL